MNIKLVDFLEIDQNDDGTFEVIAVEDLGDFEIKKSKEGIFDLLKEQDLIQDETEIADLSFEYEGDWIEVLDKDNSAPMFGIYFK